MEHLFDAAERRTSADVVFDYLYSEIASLGILPGTKISEVEIAGRFGVSRQPVRDAFSRLANLDLLQIRPQKATVVKKFSLQAITHARFVRAAVEVEVARRAAAVWDAPKIETLENNLKRQRDAVEKMDADTFHALDYAFHRILCEKSDTGFAFETIAENKAQVDRLCVLSLTNRTSMEVLLEDHESIAVFLADNDVASLETVIRKHLGRLDETVDAVYKAHSDYFAD